MLTESSNKKVKDWHVIEWFMPIQESASVGNDFFIKGMAINETTTRNGVKYIAAELERAAPSFRNKPILLDHDNKVMNTVGRTTENVNFSSMKHGIEFEAKIMDKKIKEMISDGRITDVSIGAKVENLVKSKDEDSVTAVGLEGLEISLVAVPGDPGANIGSAFEESFMIKERLDGEKIVVEKDLIAVKGGNEEKMAEEETKVEPETVVATPTEETPAVEVPAEEKSAITNVNVDMSAIVDMTKAVESMKGEIAEMKKLREEEPVVAEPAVEKPADETVGTVGAEEPAEEESAEGYVVEKAETGKGYQISMDYSQDSKLLRLAR